MQLSGTDIRLLRVFDAIVRHGGFAAAQTELNVSQSTISNQVAALETRLGVTLCQRGRSGFRLTENGQAVHQSIQRVLAALDGFVSETANLRHVLAGTLRIGLVDMLVTDAAFRLPEALAALDRRATAIRYDLQQCSPQVLQERVLGGDLQIGIGSFPHKVTGLRYIPLYDETNYLYCGRGHPLWPVPDTDLTAEFITSLRTVSRSYWREDHGNNRAFPRADAEAQGLEQQLIMVLTGAFIGYLPEHLAQIWCAAGRLRPLMPARFIYTCPIEAVVRQGAETDPMAAALIEELSALHPAAPGL